ncbi:MAG TPA: lysophospholipase [Solirubrobacteraceae bacterium]|nr:lysophospholipase [Solirubrobacteraceae bacterium]
MGTTEEGDFRGVRNRKIVWRGWSSDGGEQPRAVITIAHGYGEHSGRYEYVASRLVDEGYAVYAPDHNGHGRSDGKRGRVSLEDAVNDLDTMITTVSQGRHPGLPQFLLGHSMGGAIALRYAMAHQARLRGLILSAPLAAIDGGAALMLLAKALGVLLPGAPASPKVDARLVSHSQAVVTAYEEDELNYHGAIPARVAREFVIHVESLPADVKQVTLPTLLMWGTADKLCPPRGAEMVATNIGSSDLTTKSYPGLFHEILNEPERDQVLDEIVGWLASHLPAADPV